MSAVTRKMGTAKQPKGPRQPIPDAAKQTPEQREMLRRIRASEGMRKAVSKPVPVTLPTFSWDERTDKESS